MRQPTSGSHWVVRSWLSCAWRRSTCRTVRFGTNPARSCARPTSVSSPAPGSTRGKSSSERSCCSEGHRPRAGRRTKPHGRRTGPKSALALSSQHVERSRERDKGEGHEPGRFERDRLRIAKSNCGEAHDIHVPRDRVHERGSPKRDRQWIDRIKHRAGEEEHKVEDRGDRVDGVIATNRQRKNRVEEEPACRADDNRGGEQREAIGAERHAEESGREQDGDERLNQTDRNVEEHLSEEVLRPADRI